MFRDWPEQTFMNFDANDFDIYYPEAFAEKVRSVLAVTDRQRRRDAKKKLCNEVLAWLREDEQRGRTALENSASAVIEIVKNIERQVVQQ